MRGSNRIRRARAARTAVGALLIVSTFLVLPQTSSAVPSKRDVRSAKQRLDALNQRADQLDEEYNQARIALDSIRRKLAEARGAAARAQAVQSKARAALDIRARLAYEGVGSDLGILLGADSYRDFSDRLEFLGQISASDSDLVSRAEVARERASWATSALAKAVKESAAAEDALRSKRAELVSAVSQQEALIAELEREI